MYEYERLKKATVALLCDESGEGQMLRHLLTDNELYGDELIFAVESAEQYLAKKGRTQ